MDGPAKVAEMLSGDYNTHGKVSHRGKGKRDKAQVKLRDRMRKKMHGSAVFQTRLQPPISKTNRSLPAAMPAVGQQSGSPKKSLLYGDGYWRTQQDRYDNVIHTGASTKNREHVPFQAFMDKVIEKRQKHAQPLQNNSLLTIRSYKRPTARYAIHHPPLMKKMVGIAPLPKIKPEKKGPYMILLQTNKTKHIGNCLDEINPSSVIRIPTTEIVDSEADALNNELLSDRNIDTEAVGKLPHMNTWEPNLRNVPKPQPPAELDDRGVTNYKLQLQQANRLAEARFEYSTHSISNETLRKYSALPSIPSSLGTKKNNTEELIGSDDENKDSENLENKRQNENMDIVEKMMDDINKPNTGPKGSFRSRKSSSNEILEMMEARKKAKKGKHSETDFQTLLRTRHRYTSDMRVFKEDLTCMTKLSIISEGNSATPESQSRISSAERANSRASIASLKSVPSLEKIDEAKIVKDPIGERAIAPRLQSPGGIYLIHEEAEGTGADGAGTYAPPTTPINGRVEEGGNEVVKSNDKRNLDENSNSHENERFEGMRWISGDDEYVEVM